MDMDAVAPQVYTTTFALYLYDKLQKTATTNSSSTTTTRKRFVVALDVRPAPGWPNPPAYHLVGFIRHTVRALHRLFPDLLERCILFPIPPLAVTLYQILHPSRAGPRHSRVRANGGGRVRTALAHAYSWPGGAAVLDRGAGRAVGKVAPTGVRGAVMDG